MCGTLLFFLNNSKGPPPARSSYLLIDRIVKAAQITGAQAIHPGFNSFPLHSHFPQGYGFLSENENLVKACEDKKIVFIGPGYDAIKQMGDKISSKQIAKRAGVSIIPGELTEVNDEETVLAMGIHSSLFLLISIAKKIGYPIMVKAAGGGGGKGMRIARYRVYLSLLIIALEPMMKPEKDLDLQDPKLQVLLEIIVF